MRRIEREQLTVEKMIRIYCRHKEGNLELCESCRTLLEYARMRLSKCPFGDKKTSCRRCSVHCYRPEMKDHIRAVMRFSGPRMILYHPAAAFRHLVGK